MFGSSDMNEVGKFLGEVMELGAHGQMFYSPLQFAVWSNALDLEKRKSGLVQGVGQKSKREIVIV